MLWLPTSPLRLQEISTDTTLYFFSALVPFSTGPLGCDPIYTQRTFSYYDLLRSQQRNAAQGSILNRAQCFLCHLAFGRRAQYRRSGLLTFTHSTALRGLVRITDGGDASRAYVWIDKLRRSGIIALAR